jgi:tagaturonate epimerase
MLTLNPYSMGIGDRFARQGTAQLAAMVKAKTWGVDVTPVWNKSNREHAIIHTEPASVRAEAEAAVAALGWTGPYAVDADHIGRQTVDRFLAASDFFTLDVADFTGHPAPAADLDAFVQKYAGYAGRLTVPGIAEPLTVAAGQLRAIAEKYLLAVQEAGTIYRHIAAAKGAGTFITEVSMDETDTPQTPVELLFILAAIAGQGIPAQTIAPKFTGRFNKGVDYVGDIAGFEREFRQDLAVITFAVKEFHLPANLKLSIHSGSDKFSIYGPIRRALRDTGAGLHLKTAGTTWLEEIIGLAAAGGDGLAIAQDVYAQALGRFDELAKPYATVIDIDHAALPTAAQVRGWSSQQFADTLRHVPECPAYNPHFRQLIHVGYKVAAEMGPRYLNALDQFADVIAQNVTDNLFDRHLKRVFIG